MQEKHFIWPAGLITLIITGSLIVLETGTTPQPSEKDIHITHFRYGTSPSIIRANRGDQLNLTFSTEDTGHSFFLQDYRIDAKVSPSRQDVLVFNPLQAADPPYQTRTVKLTAGIKGFFGNFISASRFRCHVYCGPMHGFEQGDLIVRPNLLLSGSLGLLMSFFICWILKIRFTGFQPEFPSPPYDLNKKSRLLDRLLKWRPSQFLFTLPVMAVFILVILAGIFGTQVGGRNIAVMFTWALWMFLLTVLFVPLGGRIWCMVCPVPVPGEYLNRGALTQVRMSRQTPGNNKYFGPGLRWPGKLKGPWIRLILFLCLGTFSASLAGQPRWTGLVLLFFMAAAIPISLLFNRRAFCRYICPVASFISQYSPAGNLSLRVRDKNLCGACRDKGCLNGNDRGWGCPYDLLVPGIKRNMDCGLCMECFKSCPYNNVGLFWRKGEWKDGHGSLGEVWQSLVMMTLGIIYSLTIHSPWPEIRDIVNMVDKADWLRFGVYIILLWTLALGVIPLTVWLLTRLGLLLSGLKMAAAEGLKKTGPVFVPIGLSIWAAFFVAMLIPNLSYLFITLSDPFGWGWDLLGTAGTPWIQPWPGAIPWIQVLLIMAGFHMSLKKGLAIWYTHSENKIQAFKMFLPIAAFIFLISSGMIVYFTYF